MSWGNKTDPFLFACVSISLKAAFKYTSIKKVHFGENFTVKYKTWDGIKYNIF